MTAGRAARAGGPAVAREPAMAGLIVMAVNRMPVAEVEVSADLVRRLLAGQHPDLARLPVEFLANGCPRRARPGRGMGLGVRPPRRVLGAEIIKNEQALAVRVRREKSPSSFLIQYALWSLRNGRHPAPGACCAVLPGTPWAQASSFDRAGAVAAIRRAPRRSVRPRPGWTCCAPCSRGVPLAERACNFAANSACSPARPGEDQAGWYAGAPRAGLRRSLAPGYAWGAPLAGRRRAEVALILVNDGEVSGVIDFGDITAGDLVSDLLVAYMLPPPGCHVRSGAAQPGGRLLARPTPCGRGPEAGH